MTDTSSISTGIIFCTQQFVNGTKETSDGFSVDGHSLNVSHDEHFYAATKHMVTALTKALNAELRQKKTKIRVTVCVNEQYEFQVIRKVQCVPYAAYACS